MERESSHPPVPVPYLFLTPKVIWLTVVSLFLKMFMPPSPLVLANYCGVFAKLFIPTFSWGSVGTVRNHVITSVKIADPPAGTFKCCVSNASQLQYCLPTSLVHFIYNIFITKELLC